MNIPYRTRRALRRLGVALAALLVLAVAVWLCWVVWLERYVVYSREGARLDFSRTVDESAAVPALPADGGATVSIYINEGNDAVNTSTELAQLVGYYIDTEMLKDLPAVRSQLDIISSSSAVMIDVKDIYGDFYYDTNVSGAPKSAVVDTAAVSKLIAELSSSGHYLIARFPAFRDFGYVLEHHASDFIGIPVAGEGYAWTDDEGCYWLNLERSGAISYVMQIVNELKVLGFDEVVLADFDYPTDPDAESAADREGSIASAAASIAQSCATSTFAVSFVGDSDFPLPQGRCRLYVEDISAADAKRAAEATGLADPLIYVVFLTNVNDTRFNDYSVLRPLDATH